MGVPERAPTSAQELQNGHGPTRSDPEVETGRGRAGSLAQAQAEAEAEELLSRAHAHAELLRSHAEAARAEAASLHADAAALRRAARDEAAATISRAEALVGQMQAGADALRSVIEGQAEETRAELERVRSEAESFRRLLQADTDAALADAQRLRAEVQSLRAELNKLAAEFHLLSSRSGGIAGADPADLVGGVKRLANSQLDELREAIAMEVAQKLADAYDDTRDRFATGEARPPFPGLGRREAPSRRETPQDPDPVPPAVDVRERFRRIWDATYAEATGSSPVLEHPTGSGSTGRQPPEPLIGSGGWRASPASSSPAAPFEDAVEGEVAAPSPAPGRHRRRFGRG